jgi:hypothetical protein
VTVSVSVRVSVTVLVLALGAVVVVEVVSDGLVVVEAVVVVVGSVVVVGEVVVAVPLSVAVAGGATAAEVVAELDGGVVTVSDFDESSAITWMIPYTARARTTTATAPTAIIAAGF